MDLASNAGPDLPADDNGTLAPVIRFGGATVDGRPSTVAPLPRANGTRH